MRTSSDETEPSSPPETAARALSLFCQRNDSWIDSYYPEHTVVQFWPALINTRWQDYQGSFCGPFLRLKEQPILGTVDSRVVYVWDT
jgi:hypothetical protein